jgi:hypothetical protein
MFKIIDTLLLSLFFFNQLVYNGFDITCRYASPRLFDESSCSACYKDLKQDLSFPVLKAQYDIDLEDSGGMQQMGKIGLEPSRFEI